MSDGALDLRDAEIERLDAMIAALVDPADVDEVVAATRKGVKRLRAHLRLAKDGLDGDVYEAEDAGLGRIGQDLAAGRDAAVLGRTLDALEPGAGWEAASAFIDEHHAAIVEELGSGPLEEARVGLLAVRDRWPGTRLGPGDAPMVIERMYREGRVRRLKAAASGHAEDFHRWRKRVKHLRYQLEAIGAAPEMVATFYELGETLGLEHDHTVFIAFCDDHIDMCPDRRDRYVLIDRAEIRRDELRAEALASDAYEQEPGAFLRRAYLEDPQRFV